MTKLHLLRLKSPKSWNIKKKGIKWVIRPNAGSHTINNCLPLGIVIRDILSLSKTTKETKKILNDNQVLVNGVIRKTVKSLVGLMDILSLPTLNKNYRVLLNKKGKLILQEIKKDENNLLYTKIINKTPIKGGKVQINLLYGRNIILEKNSYKPGDTLAIAIDNKEIKKHLKLEKGALVYFIKGKHIGETEKLEGLHKFRGSQQNKLIIKLGDKTIETLKDCVFVVDKPLLKK